MKMLTGMLRPTGGKIYFGDHEWCRTDLYQIGALIENPPIYENLRVRTLKLVLPKERIYEVLDTVDLKNTGKKRTGHFFYGMKQRLERGRSFRTGTVF